MEPSRFLSRDRVSLRFLIVGVIVLVLLIPLLMVGGVASERRNYYGEAMQDIAASWGREQQLIGPFVVIPAVDHVTGLDDTGKPVTREVAATHIVLPAVLDMQIELQHEIRRRAIYDIPVYRAALRVSGRFSAPDLAQITSEHARLSLADARLVMGVSDTRAIAEVGTLQFGDSALAVAPGTGVDWLTSGVHARLGEGLWEGERTFSFSLDLAGSGRIAMAPVGSQSHMTLASSWPHPKFTGGFLPVERDLGPDGFDAHWRVSALARGVPEHFSGSGGIRELEALAAATVLYDPVTVYTTVDRGIKYGVLFVAMTFLVFLCFELTQGLRFHFVQYGVVGLGLILFYLTLLSLSEHLPFMLSYVVATLVIVGMLSGYLYAMTRSKALTAILAGVELLLYWVLYVLLQLEDYALITGTAVLLVGLGVVMFVTRRLHEGDDVRAV